MTNEEETPRPEEEPGDGHEGLSEDPLVGKLVPDPSQPPTPTGMLAGLLGRSPREGYWRLYFSSGLERYAEFEEEAVLNSKKIPEERPPFAGLEATRVWIRKGAQVEYTRTESRQVQAGFLQGCLAEGFRAGIAGTPGAAGAALLPLGRPGEFPPSWLLGACPSRLDPCPTSDVEACVSGIVPCQSNLRLVCPSWVDDCPSQFGCQSRFICAP